ERDPHVLAGRLRRQDAATRQRRQKDADPHACVVRHRDLAVDARRQAAGAWPTSFLNARLKAARWCAAAQRDKSMSSVLSNVTSALTVSMTVPAYSVRLS